ncbi:MAG TPA: hypothetical protein VMU81_00450 [Acetobacteraceae bacterium]|jgi:hypothetical protein|nr:hypothetical protein [Acetobacteraceae bacterium]
MDVFQEAAKAALRRCGRDWLVMSPQEQTRVIYAEMARIDLELAQAEKGLTRHKAGKAGKPSLAA